jgi:hypothetical protein
VKESLGLSYNNIWGLHQKLDQVPERAGTWTTKQLSFGDRPGDTHLIRMRDPIQAIRSLLGNPAHAKHVVYAPRKVWSDANKKNRIFSEMWTGQWWHVVQVGTLTVIFGVSADTLIL